MVDRTDIDALLIGALYGELTPADEARLTAHLESHPADRTALAELTETRSVVRDSRLFALQLEPPQSVSAMLLREAARRAPRAQREDGWFQRFVRSFTAHPAMAAAAMLVLVFGVAGTLYLRKGMQFAEEKVAAVEPDRLRAEARPDVAAAPAAPPSAEGEAAATAATASANAGSGYGVGLAEKQAVIARDQDRSLERKLAKEQVAPVVPDPAATRTKLAVKGSAGIEVRVPDPQPKDLPEAAPRGRFDDGAFAAKSERAGAGPSGGSAPAADARAAELAVLSSEGSKRKAPAKPSPKPSSVIAADGAPAQAMPPPPPAAAAPAPVIAQQREQADTISADKANDEDVDWARKQRATVIALVGSNKCREAAAAAVEIYNRAPAYYAANVATDRSIKPCLPYVASERERSDRLRAAKRANAAEAPATPPPSRK